MGLGEGLGGMNLVSAANPYALSSGLGVSKRLLPLKIVHAVDALLDLHLKSNEIAIA